MTDLPPVVDPLLFMYASIHGDLEGQRIAAQHRVGALTRTEADADGVMRGYGLPITHPDVARIAGVMDALAKVEHDASLNMRRCLRKCAIFPWVKSAHGLGEQQSARLLAAIGDPYWHVAEDRPRSVSELWAYSGLHVVAGPPSPLGGQSACATPTSPGVDATEGPSRLVGRTSSDHQYGLADESESPTPGRSASGTPGIPAGGRVDPAAHQASLASPTGHTSVVSGTQTPGGGRGTSVPQTQLASTGASPVGRQASDVTPRVCAVDGPNPLAGQSSGASTEARGAVPSEAPGLVARQPSSGATSVHESSASGETTQTSDPGHTNCGALGSSAGVAARRRKGHASNWSTEAKMRAYLCAVSCIKQSDSPYREVYLARRARTAVTHPDWTPGHSHNDGLRIAAKRILRDLWRESRRIHLERAGETP